MEETWVRSGFHVDVALVLSRVDDCQVGVKLSTSLSRHSPRRPLSRQPVAAVQLRAVLEPFATPRHAPRRLLLLLLLLFGRFHLGLGGGDVHRLLWMQLLIVLIGLRPVDVKRR